MVETEIKLKVSSKENTFKGILLFYNITLKYLVMLESETGRKICIDFKDISNFEVLK